MRLIRVVAMAIMVLALSGNVAAAEDADGLDCVPYDPGLPGAEVLPLDPSAWSLPE